MLRLLGIVSVCSVMALTADVAFAQPDAGAKSRGESYFYGNAGGSAIRSAREYSENYRTYVQAAPAHEVNPVVAQEVADSIGTYIVKAQKHMASMRKHAQTSNDKEALGSLDVIDKNLADAAKSHAEMRETCMKANVDGAASMKCCNVVDDSLAKAIAEHDKLMKRQAPVAKK